MRRHSHAPCLLLLGLLAAACGQAPEADQVATLEQHLGVPKDGFPSWQERVILVLTNRARSDPGAQSAETCGGGCATYPATKPLYHNHKLALAARFHATSLKKAGAGLQHESVCRLVSNLADIYPNKCDGDPSCACEGGSASCSCSGGKPYCSCQGGACTSTWGRIGRFGVQGTGENAAAGSSDPVKTFSQWVKSGGHWSNLNKSSHGQLGAGHYGDGPKGCWRDFWVQVFSYGQATPRLPGGAHYPKQGSPGAGITFWANYHDQAGAPRAATVNIGGTCFPMKLERGAAQSGTYRYQHQLQGQGCHRYYFSFRTATGQRVTYPSSGSYGVGIGSSAACADYSAGARPKPGKGCGGCVSASECSDGNPCTADTCSAGKCKSTPIKGCCLKDSQCDDGDKCTTDRCDTKKRRCVFARKASCGPADSGPTPGGPGPGEGPRVETKLTGDGAEMMGGCAAGGRLDPAPGWLWTLGLLVLLRRSRARG